MKKLLRNDRLQFWLCLIIGAIFIDAGLIKIRDPEMFANNIAAFHLLPSLFIPGVANSLPWLEIIGGILIAGGWQIRSVAFSLLMVTGGFIAVLGWSILQGLNIDCGCFGSMEQAEASVGMAIGRDALLMLALSLIYWQSLPLKPDVK